MNHLSNENSKATETDQQRDSALVNSAFQQSIIYNTSTENSDLCSFKIKVYNELVTNIVKDRQLRKKYCTNRLIRPIASYFALKSTISSGVIQNYSKQSVSLSEFLGITRATFFKHIKILESLKLVKRFPSGALVLSSYAKMIEVFDLVSDSVTIVNYTPGQKLYMILEALPIRNKIEEQKDAIYKRINGAKEVKDHYDNFLKVDKGNYQEAILKRQIHNFIHNTPDDLYSWLNADTQLRARSIFKMFGFKSYRSVAYLKRKLEKANICTIERERKYISEARGRDKKRYVAYLKEIKATLLFLPDKFSFANEIFG